MDEGRKNPGFTMVELLVALFLTGLIMAGVFKTFKQHQDTAIVQQTITTMQQNLRGCMTLMARDIQMAGFYTRLDSETHDYFHWNPETDKSNPDPLVPVINGIDNLGGKNALQEDGYLAGTDLILVVKASEEDRGILESSQGAAAGDAVIGLPLNGALEIDLDGDGDTDMKGGASVRCYGIVLWSDLGRGELFRIDGAYEKGNPVPVTGNFRHDYSGYDNDRVARVDMIAYSIKSGHDRHGGTVLTRKNFGWRNTRDVVGESITDLQLRYLLADGTWRDDPTGAERNVRSVQITLTSTVEIPALGENKVTGKTRAQTISLTSLVKIRNN